MKLDTGRPEKSRFFPVRIFRYGLAGVAFALMATSAHAEIVRCEFEKVLTAGMGSASNTKEFLGNAVTFDTAKQAMQVEWDRGKSDWMTAEEVKRNNRFTNFAIFTEPPSSRRTGFKIIFRLYNDNSRAEVRSEPQKSPGGGREWKQNAARYTCG